ncbi:hypothetical protein QJS10_CPA05g02334 [Acorus calamus]|uniref:Protein ROOT INITIATION DEFECTIVE 3 n=1 Tax=Acorus calamus TaxID=4465 RepID=A0AAV9EWJ3_ACOCL|nr:hypothetical protein QJS10_CPA05g02334 [Acorus calamus]
MEDEVVVVSSSVAEAGIGCWDLRTGAEGLRHKSCASTPRGLCSVGRKFLASSQLRPSSSGSVLFWSWDKPQAEVKSFPAEPINPLVSNSEGTFIIGGGSSGNIYLWEVSSGRLLKKWHAHYRAVTCLVLSDDESLLISGAEDGCVRVWSLLMLFDDLGTGMMKYLLSFLEHTLRVTDIRSGHGGCNSIIISSSEDRTCKIWSLSKGTLLRSITFPCIINAIALDPAEHAFYAGGQDGKIYIAALNAVCNSSSSHGMYIIGSLSDHSKAITCLEFSMDGVTLVSGSEDGTVRVWDIQSHHVTRILKLGKGPINNVLIIREVLHPGLQASVNAQVSVPRKRASMLMPPPLDKYINSADGDTENKTVVTLHPTCNEPLDVRYCSVNVMMNQIKELQKQGSSSAVEMELDRQKLDCKRSLQMLQQWKNMYEDLHRACVNELINGDQNVGAGKTT